MSRDIYPYLQQMRNSFDEISRILKNDELIAREELEKLQRERSLMLEEVIKLQGQQQERIASSSSKTADTNEYKSIQDRDRKLQSSSEDHVAVERGENFNNRHESGQFLRGGCEGLRSDVKYIPLQSPYPIESKKYKLNDEYHRLMAYESYSPPIRPVIVSSLNDSRFSNIYVHDDDRHHLVDSKSPNKDDMVKRRVPGISSTLSFADLRVGKSSSHVDTKRRTTPISSKKEQTFWINIWPCFGTFASSVCKPTRIVVNGSYRFMEQLTEKAGVMTGCQPAPSVLYEPDGKSIRSLAQLVPEQHYLLFPSGGFYRREALPHALLQELVREAKMALKKRCDTHED
ncbi:uncharacterized protein TM35_000172030 [Trypanosoma theileri]|uniref:Doublecortin domain-containing protein n=1 Tax=Trypanosoma theileri TaxID=67003 RepID=A0A1X0NUP1_9TRYP|nr:uncharacterized protein TM35_000172030 [Trypanosoma theileri]ORC88331.1 hypothetical protein TM35_000172030 [Trypanosoma theileri]